MIVYHGSSVADIKILEPQFDERLGLRGIFISDEPFGPSLYALLPSRSKVSVDYETKDGLFISGKVLTPTLNDEGWLYTFEVAESSMQTTDNGDMYLTISIPVPEPKKVLKTELMKVGWEIELAA